MKKTLGLVALGVFAVSLWQGAGSASAQAAAWLPIADDSDLTSGPAFLGKVDPELRADETRSAPTFQQGLIIQVIRIDHGVPTPVPGLRFEQAPPTDANGETKVPCSAAKDLRVTAVLENRFYKVTHGGTTYRLTADAKCGNAVTLKFNSDSNGGQALGIWQVATRAHAKLASAVDLKFWDAPITFVWPGSGDYYSFGTVNLTRGDHWDVVGHEMGHAIYDLGNLGAFGGGSHRIDECYTDALALSEGWASFFSGWVSVDLADADAKFEYMVPRRAPIRFESIPTDVCKGPRNEWRVNGYFWDLIDMHADGEDVVDVFARTWTAMLGSRVDTVTGAARALERGGFDSSKLKLVWDLNFLTTN